MGASATIEQLRLDAEKQSTVDALMKSFFGVPFPVVDGLVFDVVYKPAAAIEKLDGD